MLKLDRGIMNTFQLQSVNIYAKQANYRGGALCAPPHQYTGEKSPSGIGLKAALTEDVRGEGKTKEEVMDKRKTHVWENLYMPSSI